MGTINLQEMAKQESKLSSVVVIAHWIFIGISFLLAIICLCVNLPQDSTISIVIGKNAIVMLLFVWGIAAGLWIGAWFGRNSCRHVWLLVLGYIEVALSGIVVIMCLINPSQFKHYNGWAWVSFINTAV